MPQEAVDDLIGLHDAMLRNETVEGFLRELAGLAARVVPGGGSCGMTLSQQGQKPATVACTDPLATQVDQVQYRDGDGPCLAAMREGQLVLVDSMAEDGRWPSFGKRAASMGVRSSLSLPLLADGAPTGALNVYAPQEAAFGPEQVGRGERLAQYGSGALTLVLRLTSVIARNEQLRASLESRAVIDQAMGVIMAVRRCTRDQALAILRTASQNQNVKLRDLAADIVAQASGERPGPPNPFQVD
jgi:GAF domain-containing protein